MIIDNSVVFMYRLKLSDLAISEKRNRYCAISIISCNIRKLGMYFYPTKYKVIIQHFAGPLTPFIVVGEPLEVVDRFTYREAASPILDAVMDLVIWK